MSQRPTSVLGTERKGRFCVADLSYSNWVSDLLLLCCFSSDKTMCGQRTLCVYVVDKITVFSFQNEMTKRG